MPGRLTRGTATDALQTSDHLSVNGRGVPNVPGHERHNMANNAPTMFIRLHPPLDALSIGGHPDSNQ
eukprot:10891664-Lingulodinium_polyedra.AAC.1